MIPDAIRYGNSSCANEVATADLHGIETERLRAEIHQSFRHESRDRSPNSAVRSRRRLAGGDAPHSAAIGPDLVGAGKETHDLDRLQTAGPRINRIGPDISEDVGLQGDGDTVLVKSHLGIDDLAKRLTAAADVFQAVCGPFERATELAGHDADQQFLRIERALRSETSAHVGCDHPQAAAGKAKGFGNRIAHDARDVRGGIKRDGAAFGVILRRIAARLHRERRLAGHLETAADPDGRVFQIGLNVTFLELARNQHVGAGLFVQQRSVLRDCLLATRHRPERFELDLDEFERVFREVSRSGDDSDDGFADIANLSGS